MPLQTAEAPTVTADLGPCDVQLESLPVFNPTDGARTQVISTLDIAEEAKKTGDELCHEHISGLKGEHILEHAMSMQRDLAKLASNVWQVYPISGTRIHPFFFLHKGVLPCCHPNLRSSNTTKRTAGKPRWIFRFPCLCHILFLLHQRPCPQRPRRRVFPHILPRSA